MHAAPPISAARVRHNATGCPHPTHTHTVGVCPHHAPSTHHAPLCKPPNAAVSSRLLSAHPGQQVPQ
eukprot:350899-Chlamydomonas_euryale.AAC.2